MAARPAVFRWRFAALAALLLLARLALYDALAPRGLVPGLCQWDCAWYVGLAAHGYDLHTHLVGVRMQANWAFFPLFPLLMRAVGWSGLSLAAAGIAVATVSFWAVLVLGAAYRARTRPDARPWTWLLLLLAWPYTFYFDAPYSESLYAALALACLLALAARRPWLAAAAAALLSATRPTGVLLAAWIGAERLWRAAAARGLGARLAILAPAVLAPLGLVAFMAYLWWRVGDPLAFAHIQSTWDHHASDPLSVLLAAARAADPRHGHFGLLYEDGWALLGLAAGAILARRRPAEAWFVAATVLMALSAGTVSSMPRFVAASPVMLLLAADLLEELRPWLRWPLLAACAAVQLVFLFGWFRGALYLM